jgi:prefoldin subunit 5
MDDKVEQELANVEQLIQKGYFGRALETAKSIKVGESNLRPQYQLMIQQKVSKVNLRIAERHQISGNLDQARKYYHQALLVAFPQDEALKKVFEMASGTFDRLVAKRDDRLTRLARAASTESYEDWCQIKKEVNDTRLVLDAGFRAAVHVDLKILEKAAKLAVPPLEFGITDPGYVDPVHPEVAGIKQSITAAPGSTFEFTGRPPASVNVNVMRSPMRASMVMPLVATVFSAKAQLFAMEQNLDYLGCPRGVIPLYRYEHLRDKAKVLAEQVQRMEDRMIPVRFKLDDFIEKVKTMERHLSEMKAELNAVNARIGELTQALTTLSGAAGELGSVVHQLRDFEDECDLEWWEVLLAVFLVIVIVVGLAVACYFCPAIIGATSQIGGAIGGAIAGALIGGGVVTGIWGNREITCDNVDQAHSDFRAALTGVEDARAMTQAEIQALMAQRDILEASISALTEDLEETYKSDKERVLDSETMGRILQAYRDLRHTAITRATVIARKMEEAYNFQTDGAMAVISDSYFDSETKGYTAAEKLLRDIEEFDYVRITSRNQKCLQLSQTVSLAFHRPMSFAALKFGGGAVFSSRMEEFDRWYPGTYMQRLKEVRVETIIDGEAVPIQGYLSNYGTSWVRFRDPGNKVPVDGKQVVADPDRDVAKLCYKRLQRRRHNETMSFPLFQSALADDRFCKIQDSERNAFENVGLESTWKIEFLPDQPYDLALLTDVRITFQFEALFDENLKKVVESKRFQDRRDVAVLSFRNLLEKQGRAFDPSSSLEAEITRSMFQFPQIDKNILSVGFIIKPKGKDTLQGPATLDASFQEQPAIQVATDDRGIIATGKLRHVGSNPEDLLSMCQGKKLEGKWSIKLSALPPNFSATDIEDVLLIMNYEYAPAA